MRRLAPLTLTYLFVPVAFAAPPEGAFLSLPAEDPGACARQCSEDGLCISWTFTDQTCALSAIAPAAPSRDLIGGLSERAPEQFRLRNIAASPKPLTPADEEVGEAPASPTQKWRELGVSTDSPMLLGGPGPEEQPQSAAATRKG